MDKNFLYLAAIAGAVGLGFMYMRGAPAVGGAGVAQRPVSSPQPQPANSYAPPHAKNVTDVDWGKITNVGVDIIGKISDWWSK